MPAADTAHAAPRELGRLYLCTDARRERGDLAEFADAALAGGVDIIQLRDKGSAGEQRFGPLEARAELDALAILADAAARHKRLLAVNDRADIARAAGADVLHLGQDDLPLAIAREIVGPGVVIGRSCHDEAQVDAAVGGSARLDGGGAEPAERRRSRAEAGTAPSDLGGASPSGPGGPVDYFCVGPCWPTPTKPGRPAPGLDLVRYAAAHAAGTPWFAIGGIDAGRLDQVLAAGATRIVVVRAITAAEDPGAAAAALAAALA